jgi:hypothetical protein
MTFLRFSVQKIYDYLRFKVFFASSTRFFIEACLEIMISCSINFLKPKANPIIGDTISLAFSYLLLIFLTFATIAFTVFILKYNHKDKRYKKIIKMRFGDLLEEINTKSDLALLFHTAFVLRRAIFVMTVLLEKEYLYIQIILFQISNLLACSYYLHAMPFKERNDNYIEIFNQITIMIHGLFTPIFTDYVDDA